MIFLMIFDEITANIQASKALLLTAVTVVGLFLNTGLFAEEFTVHFFGSLLVSSPMIDRSSTLSCRI
jgi:hypothetical protein